MKYPFDVQQEVFSRLIEQALRTTWGVQYGYDSISSIEEYQKRVPISSYDDVKPYINRLRDGEQNLLWPTEIKCLSHHRQIVDTQPGEFPSYRLSRKTALPWF